MTTSSQAADGSSGDAAPSLGHRLRAARTAAGLSLREVARRLGVSASFVSQLENGKSQPSVATLYSLAQLLGLSIDRLFDAPDDIAPSSPGGSDDSRPRRAQRSPAEGTVAEAGMEGALRAGRVEAGSTGGPREPESRHPAHLSLTRPGERTRLVMDSGVIWEQLAGNADPHLDFMEILYPPGSSSTTDDRMLRHDSFEYGYLVEGELRVTLGFEEFTLRTGDALSLDSSLPHRFTNVGTVPARGIWFVHHRHD